MSFNPLSPKIVAAASGAGLGTILGTFITWLLGAGLWGVGYEAGQVEASLAAVPTPVSGLVVAVLAVAFAGVPGYQVPDPQRDPASNPNVVAYNTAAGVTVAGPAGPAANGTPVDVDQSDGLHETDGSDYYDQLAADEAEAEAGLEVDGEGQAEQSEG